MLIAEEFLLLSLDDTTGRNKVGTERLDPALAAAVLVELALAERIAITGEEAGRRGRGRVNVTFTSPTDDPVLDDALAFVEAHEGKRVGDLVSPMSWHPMVKDLRQRLLTRLAAAGLLEERQGRTLGVFPNRTWPAVDGRVEAEVRERVRRALVDGTTPTERTVALIALLDATGQAAAVLPGADKKLVKQRAKALTEGDWAAKAVKEAIDAVAAAMIGSLAATAASVG